MWLKATTPCKPRGVGRLGYWGIGKLPEAWKKSLLVAKPEKLLEPLDFLEDSGKSWNVAEARKSAEVNTWAADELEIWGVRGYKR